MFVHLRLVIRPEGFRCKHILQDDHTIASTNNKGNRENYGLIFESPSLSSKSLFMMIAATISFARVRQLSIIAWRQKQIRELFAALHFPVHQKSVL